MESSDSGTPNQAALADAADAAFDAAVPAEIAKLESTEGSTPAVASVPSTETADATGSTPVAEARPVAPETQDTPEYQNLLAKYGGDKNAAAQSYWATVKAASTLTKEKEELTAKLAAYEAQGSTPKLPEAKPAQEIPTELRRYDENIRKVENDFKATQLERGRYVNESIRLDNVIASLDAEIDSNDLTVDRDDLTRKLRVAMKERRAVGNYVSQLDDKLKGFDYTWQDLTDRRAMREQLLEATKAIAAEREAKARSDDERESGAYVAQFSTSWNGTIEKVSKDPAVIPDALSGEFQEYVRAMGKAYVADGTPIEDVAKFVADAAAKFMGSAKKFHSAQSTEYAKLKKADAAISSPEGANALASETKRPRADWTQAQWAAYEENINLDVRA